MLLIAILTELSGDRKAAEVPVINRAEERKLIILYLNRATGRKYRWDTIPTIKAMNARFQEGYEVADFCKVIDNKVKQWLNDEKMHQYLRPETLFSNKFTAYLNDEPVQAISTPQPGLVQFMENESDENF